MKNINKTALLSLALTMCFSTTTLANASELDLKFAGTMEFTDSGALFVGDNYNGAIYAFDMTGDSAPDQISPINIRDIDVKLADVLGVRPSAIAINDMVTLILPTDGGQSVKQLVPAQS